MAKRTNHHKRRKSIKYPKVHFYITNHKNKTAVLPVAPSEVHIRDETDDSVSNVIGLGEINRVGGNKIKSIKFSSFFPIDSSAVPYTNGGKKQWKKATSYINFLNNVYKSHKPCRLVITGARISLKMTISAFEYGMEDGNSKEFTFTLEFKEYRHIKAEKLNHKKKKQAKHGKRRSKPQNKINRGSKVLVNGHAYLTKSAVRGVPVRKLQCTITLVSRGAKHPYYVRSTAGTNMGWISRSSIV